jgi:hypothetical protein
MSRQSLIISVLSAVSTFPRYNSEFSHFEVETSQGIVRVNHTKHIPWLDAISVSLISLNGFRRTFTVGQQKDPALLRDLVSST